MKIGQNELEKMVDVGATAARLAGQRAMREIECVRTSVKSADQLVTQADTICQQIIIDHIRKHYPDHGFIGEEGPAGKMYKEPPRGRDRIWWVIDPIDGTNNFAKRMFLFTMVVGVMHEGRPVAGVTYEPATDSMFTGMVGGHAECNGRRITVSEDIIDRFASVGMDSHFDHGVPGWAVELMGRARFRNLGSSGLQMAYLANGSLIASIFAEPKIWDIAAGVALTEAAGGIVSDYHGRPLFPLDLDQYEAEELPTLASNRKVYQEMLDLLSK